MCERKIENDRTPEPELVSLLTLDACTTAIAQTKCIAENIAGLQSNVTKSQISSLRALTQTQTRRI